MVKQNGSTPINALPKRIIILTTLLPTLVVLSACTPPSAADGEEVKNAQTTKAQTLRIAAAANLSDVLPAIIKGYQANKATSAPNIDVTYASSGKLYAQIVAGAPYDVFLSANQDFPAKLAATMPNKEQNQQPFTYARGQLALYSVTQPINTTKNATLAAMLNAQPTSTITIANPELAPYGASAKAYLQDQQQYDALQTQKRLIQAENIGQAFQYAHTGSVDYGFVAQSQVTALHVPPKQFYTLPPAAYPPILQDGIVISQNKAGADFSNYLQSTSAQRYFSQAGYLSVQ